MALQYSPKIVTDSLVMCLDPSQNKSYPTTDLPVKNGLLVWLDAADDSTFSYSSGTEVSQWRDKSGNNFHANQATVANQPSRNTVVNSRKSVNFNSTNGDRLRVNSGMVFTNSVTAIVFIKPGTQNFAYADILDQDHGMDGYNGWVIQRNNTASQWLVWLANSANTTWLNTNAVSYADNTPQIVTLRKGSSTLTLSSNGTSSGDVAIADQQIRQANYVGLNIGTWRAGNELYATSRHYNGEICEILVYNRALSLTEIKQVHTYLGQKWGILNTDRSAIDLSGNNNNGLLGNGTAADMPSFDFYNKGALKLDGSTDYIAVSDSAVLSPSTVTVSLWIKRNSYQSSITNFLRRNDFDSYALMATNNSDTVWFRIRNSVPAVADAQTSMPLNTWVNLVGTFDGSNVRIYKDGAFANIVANTSPINYAATNSTMIIGRDDAVSGRYAPASYGSILIYSRALSAAEILQNYNAQKSRFTNTIVQQGLVLNLDAGNNYSYAGSGTTWYDVSGNNYNSTLNGSLTFSDNSISLGSSTNITNYISVPASSLSGLTSWAIQMWLNINASNAIESFLTCGEGNNFLWFFEGRSTLAFQNTGSSAISYPTAIGEWFLFTATGTGGSISVYKNGLSLGSFANTTTITISSSIGIILGQEMDNNTTGGFDATQAFLGKYGSVSFYNRVLSASEVLQNYNATKGRFGL